MTRIYRKYKCYNSQILPFKQTMPIPFNKPYLTGKELLYIQEALSSGKISGDGVFSKKCQSYFEKKYGYKKVLLTTSCTDALEMASILADIKEGDEVIMPSYTFVSTANAFILRGAKIIFADSRKDNPCIDETQIESLITSKTKAIVVVHYAGIACDMDYIKNISVKYNLFLIEDAAQAIDSYYNNKPLGSFGHFATFSFHETKNITCGEGGMLVINDEKYIERAEIIREKGTNRTQFLNGFIDKYNWIDVGSSFLPSEITAAFLWAQLESLEDIQEKRIQIWDKYYSAFSHLNSFVGLPVLPAYATNNANSFYITTQNKYTRDALINHLKSMEVSATFHYISLHQSPYFHLKHDGRVLKEAERYTNCLLRLPLYIGLTDETDLELIAEETGLFFSNLVVSNEK